MKILVRKLKPEIIESNLLAYPMAEEDSSALKKKDVKGFLLSVQKAVKDGDFKGEEGESFLLRPEGSKTKRLLLIGLGKSKEINEEKIRKAYSLATQVANKKKYKKLAALLPSSKIKETRAATSATEGVILTDYIFDRYKTDKKNIRTHIEEFLIAGNNKLKKIIEETKTVCESVNFVRNLVNEPAAVMTPAKMAEIAKKIAKENGLTIKVMEKSEIQKKGLNLVLAVSQGSKYSPRFIVLEYRGNKQSKKKHALVGKGITFDTGGINLKPTGYIETMKEDMSGAAVVLGTLQALAQLKIKINVAGVVPCVENMIGSGAVRPSDIVKSYSGKTVEIGNTDAEGRLILADALAYTEKNIKPVDIIELSTLTGAIMVTFGQHVAGMISTDDRLAKKIFDAGEKTYERVWRLPLYEEYIEEMKGSISDLSNIGVDKWAGSITAAGFLKSFVEKTPWVHLDIAGTAFLDKERSYRPKGGTGFGVRLLVEFFKNG